MSKKSQRKQIRQKNQYNDAFNRLLRKAVGLFSDMYPEPKTLKEYINFIIYHHELDLKMYGCGTYTKGTLYMENTIKKNKEKKIRILNEFRLENR